MYVFSEEPRAAAHQCNQKNPIAENQSVRVYNPIAPLVSWRFANSPPWSVETQRETSRISRASLLAGWDEALMPVG